MKSNLYLRFSDGRIGLTRFAYLRDAADMFSQFDDDDYRARYGICHCWITEDGSSFVILGDAPAGWSHGHPVADNAVPAHAHP